MREAMAGRDTILTLKDWINSFWNFQEEDLQFFKQDFKDILANPKELLSNLKKRMQTRKIYYKLFKHLSWKELSLEELEWVQHKLDQILARETIITEKINKLLDVISALFLEEEGEVQQTFPILPEEKIIFH